MRQPKPRWREDRKAWVAQVGGTLRTLATGKGNKQDAREVPRARPLSHKPQTRGRKETIRLPQFANQFLDWSHREKATATLPQLAAR